MADMINVLNTIRANASAEYQSRVPEATRTNISAVGNPILTYSATMNEFLSSLVNRIGMTIVRTKELKNPLEILKQGNMPLGKDIEEIWVNPAKAEAYNPTSTDLLSQKIPDVKALYYRLNRRDKYSVTISKPQLNSAFTDYQSLEKLLNGIITSLYSGNYLDEFILAKNLFADAITTNKIIKQTITPVTDENSAKSFIKDARTIFQNFAFPSSAFNAYTASGGTGEPVVTWTPAEDVRFIIRSDINAITDVEILAKSFNMDKANFLGQSLIVDSFGTAENCVAVMCDKSYTQIYDNYTELSEFQNASNLTWNYYYHKWQTYAVSTLCNAVAFVTE